MKLNETMRTLIGTTVLIVGIILINAGINHSENIVVLQKAIRICMECIGIG